MSDSEVDDGTGGLFQEPADFYEPEKPATFCSHTLKSGRELRLRLVGHNPLWGHLLWNAGRTISDYLEEHAEDLIKGKTVLELGAGAGLPSIVAALHGASKVVLTDYPDADLVDNLRYNVEASSAHNIAVEGYLWGAPVQPLLSHLLPPENQGNGELQAGFDILILADLLFNHSEHAKLVSSVQQTLSRTRTSRALVFFTPYRPWLLDKDLAFFDAAREGGLKVEKIMEVVMEKVLFEEDPGDELLRRTVFGYTLQWEEAQLVATT